MSAAVLTLPIVVEPSVEHAAIAGMLAVLRAHDADTAVHSCATGALARDLALAAGLPSRAVERARKGGLLHDVGKIAVAREILTKPARLDRAEWAAIAAHPEVGSAILIESAVLASYADVVVAHHERWDGEGYPFALRGDAIPVEARVVAIADAYQAMISDRPYRTRRSVAEALVELRAGRGTQWDPDLVDVMLTLVRR